MTTSRIAGFYNLPLNERLEKLASAAGVTREELDAFRTLNLSPDQADHIVENVVGTFNLPLGIGLNFLVNGRDVLVPKAIEEPSVIAGASFMAKLARTGGGFVATTSEPNMIGQMQVLDVQNVHLARLALLEHKSELEDSLSINDIPDFTIRIEEVTKLSCSCGTDLHTGWVPSRPDPLDAKGTFFYSTLHSGSIPQVMDRGIYFLLGNRWLCPIKNSSFIRAGRNAVPATYTPIVIHHNNAVWFLPGGMDRTYLHAGRILALLTLHGEINEPLLRDGFRIIVMFGIFQIDQISSLEPENPDPMKLRIMARKIVFFCTGINTSSATNTP